MSEPEDDVLSDEALEGAAGGAAMSGVAAKCPRCGNALLGCTC